MTKKYPKVGFGSKCKTNVKNVRALQYRGVHVHVCRISGWSQYAAGEEVDKNYTFPHVHVLQWNLDILNFYIINLLV